MLDVTDDGKVNVAAANGEIAQKAVELVRVTEEARSVKHILEWSAEWLTLVLSSPFSRAPMDSSISLNWRSAVSTRSKTCQEGDEILVKVINVDRQGKIRLSRKEVLIDQKRAAGEEIPVEEPRANDDDDRRGRGRGGDRRGGDRRGGGGGRGRSRARR